MGSSHGNKRVEGRLRMGLLMLGSALICIAGTFGLSFSSSYICAMSGQYGTALADRFDCRTCHTNPPALNPYGNDYLNSGYDFSAIEFLDSDGDGFTNIFEINAITNPGDTTSRPP